MLLDTPGWLERNLVEYLPNNYLIFIPFKRWGIGDICSVLSHPLAIRQVVLCSNFFFHGNVPSMYFLLASSLVPRLSSRWREFSNNHTLSSHWENNIHGNKMGIGGDVGRHQWSLIRAGSHLCWRDADVTAVAGSKPHLMQMEAGCYWGTKARIMLPRTGRTMFLWHTKPGKLVLY